MRDERSNRTQDPVRPISSQKAHIRTPSLSGSNRVGFRPGESNRSDNDDCNVTMRNNRDSLVVPLALGISNLRMTSGKQRYHSSIEIPLPSPFADGGISSKSGRETDRVSENGTKKFLKKQTKIASLKSGVRNFIRKESAEKRRDVLTHGSSPRSSTSSIGSDKEAVHISGLDNLGNTCFMNCILQCLLSCPHLTEYFNEDKYISDIRNSESEKVQIAKAFADLLHRTRGKGAPLAYDGQSTSPTHLKELIAEDESDYFDDSLQLQSTLECLKEYTREEILCGDEMINCEVCGDRKPCLKRLKIMRRPQMLLLHLKRFCHTNYEVRKLSTGISFPLLGLHLDPFLSPDSEYAAKSVHERYDLHAMVDHMGSMSYGHYTATCLSSIDRCFYKLDDEQVEKLSSKNQSHIGKHSSTVYVLFYKLVQEP